MSTKSRKQLDGLPCTTKQINILQLIKELRSLKAKDSYEKAVVVSQWTSMLEIVAVHLKTMGMRITEINGEMIDA